MLLLPETWEGCREEMQLHPSTAFLQAWDTTPAKDKPHCPLKRVLKSKNPPNTFPMLLLPKKPPANPTAPHLPVQGGNQGRARCWGQDQPRGDPGDAEEPPARLGRERPAGAVTKPPLCNG